MGDLGEPKPSDTSSLSMSISPKRARVEADVDGVPATPKQTPTTPGTPTTVGTGSASKKEEKPRKRPKKEVDPIKLEEERRKKEEERLKREEEKRKKEEERLKREEERRKKNEEREEEKRKKEEERLKREEEKRKKEEERLKKEEEERPKREEEKRKKEEERLRREDEKRKKEEERLKREEEKRRKEEEKEKERLKQEEKKAKQANFFTNFFNKSPAPAKVKTLKIESVQIPSPKLDIENDKENTNATESPCKDKEALSTSADNLKLEDNDTDMDIEVLLIKIKKSEAPKFSPMPFQIKSRMAVAPLLRRDPLSIEDRNIIDSILNSSDKDKESLADDNEKKGADDAPKKNKYRSEWVNRAMRKEMRKSGPTVVEIENDGEAEPEPEVKIVEVELVENPVPVDQNRVNSMNNGYIRYRYKLLQFDENKRPAYWGTWKRKAMKVNALHPLEKENELDYDEDSGEEWDDEPEDGEEIENSDGEEEAQDPADGELVDEEDEGWMVPHGYLSESEGEGDHMDLDVIKSREKEFFRSLKEQVKMGIPVIQTEKLGEFRMIFPPKVNITMRRSYRKPKPTSTELKSQSKGFLALELPSDDEDDRDWSENGPQGDGEDAVDGGSEDEDSSDDSSEEYNSGSDSEFIEDMEIDDVDVDISTSSKDNTSEKQKQNDESAAVKSQA